MEASETYDKKPTSDIVNAVSNGDLYMDEKAEKKKIMKNVFLISLAFFCNFTSYSGLGKLQSSLHRVDGMGVITQSVTYATLVISCLFVPKPFISLVGHKWAMAISYSGYILWMAANGYAVWGTMVTTSILVGLFAAPLWTAQCSYFTRCAVRYAKMSGEAEDAVVARFFGIFFMFFQFSGIIGSIISSTVLQQSKTNLSDDADIGRYCGMNDCPGNNYSSSTWEDPSKATVWTMVGIYIVIATLAIVITAVFVDQLPDDLQQMKRRPVAREVGEMCVATFKHMRLISQLLLIPITMLSGFEQSFFSAEFTKSFITCSVGIWMIGIITIPYGIVNGLVSFISGIAVKYIGRVPTFISGAVLQLVIMIILFTWTPSQYEVYVLFIVSCLWGFCDGIWQTQINGLYGAVFTSESEAAFSNYRLWESMGFIIAYAYSAFICTSAKAYVLIGFLLLGMAGYGLTEYRVKQEKSSIIPEKVVAEKEMQNSHSNVSIQTKEQNMNVGNSNTAFVD